MASFPLEDASGVPTVNPTAAPGNDYEHVETNPNQFGGAIAAGLGQVDQTLLKRQDELNQVHASDVNTWLADKITDKYSDFSKLQGRAAQDALPMFKSDLDSLYKQAQSQAGNLQAQGMIAQSGRYLTDAYYRYGTNHADEQFKTWQTTSAQQRAQQNGSLAGVALSNSDLQGVDVHLNASDDEVKKMLEPQGYDPETINNEVQKNRGRNVADLVKQVATVGLKNDGNPDPVTANALYQKYRGDMDPASQVAVDRFIKPALMKWRGESIAEAATGPVDMEKFLDHTLEIENPRHDVSAVSPTGVRGLYQITDGTWAQYGRGNRDDPTAQRDAARRISVANYGMLNQGLGRPPTEGELYLAYQQGPVAALKLISNPDAPAGQLTDPRNISANGGNPNAPASSFVQKWTSRFPGGQIQGSPGMPDKSTAISRAINLSGGNPDVQIAAVSAVNRQYALVNSQNAAERQSLQTQVPDIIKAAESGDDVTFPEERVRAVYPPAEAQQYVDRFHIAQTVGNISTGAKYASPDEISDLQRDVSSGQGAMSTILHAALPNADEPTQFGFRQAAERQLASVLTTRQKQLYGATADPAKYVQGEPTVAAAAQAAQSDPSKIPDLVNATLGVQAHLGVPAADQHFLTRDDAVKMAGTLMQPGADVVAGLAGLQKQFGPAYPQIFRDLATLGKLPTGYQAVGAVNNPNDAVLLSKALQESPAKGGSEKSWADRVESATGDKTAFETMRHQILVDPDLQKYTDSLRGQNASPEMIDSVTKDVQTLAYAKVYWNHEKPAAATADAVGAFTGHFSFDMPGGPRVPSEIAPLVQSGGRAMLEGLKPEDVAPPRGIGGAGQNTAADYVNTIRAAPTWINNTNSDGLWLLGPMGERVMDKGGRPLELKFKDAGTGAMVQEPRVPPRGSLDVPAGNNLLAPNPNHLAPRSAVRELPAPGGL